MKRAGLLALLIGATLPSLALAQAVPLDPLVEIRYCGPPKRDAKNAIVRRSDVLTAFKKYHPCPLDVLKLRPVPLRTCPGWQMNHVWPLAKGGCDAVWNLDWMPVEIKTCKEDYCRDRFELKIYNMPPTAATP